MHGSLCDSVSDEYTAEADAGTQCSGGHLEEGPAPFSAHRISRLILLIFKVKKCLYLFLILRLF